MNFASLWLDKKRLNSLLYLFLYPCHCCGKIPPAFAWTKSVISKNGFAFDKSVTKEPCAFKCSLCSSKLCSCSAEHLWNIFLTTWQQKSRDECRWVQHSLTKKKIIILSSQSNPPSSSPSLSGTAAEKHAVHCAQQVPPDSRETVVSQTRMLLSLLCLLMRVDEWECWHIKTHQTRILDRMIKWNLYCTGLAWVSHAGCAA